ncbi:MAG: ribose 5-phosphate isomerase B [Spirochaetota bacterium]
MSDNSAGNIVQNIVSGIQPDEPRVEPQGDDINLKDNVRRVAVGADHGGYEMKEKLKVFLRSMGYHVTDVGTFSKDSVDYPDFARKVAQKVAGEECERGVMIDGAGIGSCMACNKVKGIRAALCYNLKTIVNSREHNNANVLTLGGPLHTEEQVFEMVKVWLGTRFAGGRHWRRVNKIMALERGR